MNILLFIGSALTCAAASFSDIHNMAGTKQKKEMVIYFAVLLFGLTIAGFYFFSSDPPFLFNFMRRLFPGVIPEGVN